MKGQLSGLHTEGDARITILQFLSTASSPDLEIKKITAGKDISLAIETFFHESPDYQNLQSRIERQQKVYDSIPEENTAERIAASAQMKQLRELEKRFKVDVLQLADIFLRMNVNSGRLSQARTLFESGQFMQADTILKGEDLRTDQNDLLLAVDYWERRKQDILNQINLYQSSL